MSQPDPSRPAGATPGRDAQDYNAMSEEERAAFNQSERESFICYPGEQQGNLQANCSEYRRENLRLAAECARLEAERDNLARAAILVCREFTEDGRLTVSDNYIATRLAVLRKLAVPHIPGLKPAEKDG